MMTMIGMAKYMMAEPFRPFRVIHKDGRKFDVDVADSIRIGISRMQICTLWSNDPEMAKLREVELALDEVAAVEWMEASREVKSS